MRRILLSVVLLTWHLSMVLGQNYNSRAPMNELPYTPSMDDFDYDYYTDDYGFSEEKNIYRWNVQAYPNPQDQYQFCNRLKPSFVCDPDRVLDREQADKLDSYILQLYNETLCICGENCKSKSGGIIVGIALLKHVFQPYNQHPSKTIRTFTETIRETWKLGSCENDIVIVVATTDRLSYTDVGKATSSYMSLKEAHTIFLENKGNFSNGLFFEGLSSMLSDYHRLTRNMKVPVQKEQLDIGKISGIIIGAIAALGLLLFIGFALFSYCRRRKNKDPEKATDEQDHRKSEGVASSWTKQDIKVMFGSLKSSARKPIPESTQYQPCDMEDRERLPTGNFTIEEEELDTNPASSVTPNKTMSTNDTSTTTAGDTSTTELLDKELSDAVEDIAQTFETFQPKRNYRGHETDL